ncbi:class I SAM-dependent methyltransferase [Amycolatopsis cihanbeyliensis]
MDVLPSPNIWYHPDAYELENRVQDADQAIWRVLRRECDWAGKDVLDIGCGDGFHLARFAETARSVVGVEPHGPLVERAARRVAAVSGVTVRRGTAARLPLSPASVDLVHARTAYFFGPGCGPGLRAAERALRRGGTLAIVDLDVGRGPYGDWMRADLPGYDPAAVDRFFAEAGFRCLRVDTRWRFPDRKAVETVLRIEFSAPVAERAIAQVLRMNQKACGELVLPVGYRVLLRPKRAGPRRLRS